MKPKKGAVSSPLKVEDIVEGGSETTAYGSQKEFKRRSFGASISLSLSLSLASSVALRPYVKGVARVS